MTRESTRKQAGTAGMLDLVEHAVALVRETGWGALSLYYLGAMPFVALFVLFFADMSIMAYDPSRLVLGSLLLGVFFVWMKIWQAVYACRLWDRVQDRSDLEERHWLRLAARQAFLQPFGLLLLPLALLALIPYGAVYAYYQNLTVLDRGGDAKARELSREARHRAMDEPRQVFLLIWAISPSIIIFVAALVYLVTPLAGAVLPDTLMFAVSLLQGIALVLFFPMSPLPVILAANMLIALIMGPALLQMLFGISTSLLSTGGIWSDSPTFIAVAGIVYLLLDPLVKAAFVLRCFRGEAARTGEDLRVVMRRTRTLSVGGLVLAGLAAAFLSGSAAWAQESGSPASPPTAQTASPSTEQLNGRIDEVFKDRAYAWRIPGVKDLPKTGVVGAFFDGVNRTIQEWLDWAAKKWHDFKEWLKRWIFGGGGDSTESGRVTGFHVDMTVLVLLLLLVCIILVFCWWYRQRRPEDAPMAAVPIAEAQPDIADENTLASDLPDDEWARMAARLSAQGEYRGALRAAFLSLLAWLAAQDFVRVARAKSNHEYGSELERRAHARPDCLAAFQTGVTVFEPAWYGDHPATAEQVGQIMNLGERLRRGELV